MFILILFAFLAGLVTVLSPCILPLLPIILSSSTTSGRQKPIGIVLGFIASFTFFTLFLSSLVKLFGLPPNLLRNISIFILTFFGASLFIPSISRKTEVLFSKLSRLIPSNSVKSDFFGGFIIGLSLGVLWTPCVGPILASVISLALTGTVTGLTFFITLAYSIGTAIPMFFIIMAGSTALSKVPWLVKNSLKVQKLFGLVMILTAILIYFNFDRQFQLFILNNFPDYGPNLTKLESSLISQSPAKVNGPKAPEFAPGQNWLNSSPLLLTNLKGKVVLVDFWTYTCINCIRTLPHLTSWYEKYRDLGLVIVGVHTPEFEFEKDTKNVTHAIQDFNIKYPVVQDNDFSIWNSYSNRYWPAKYLIDANGVIRYTHFGEGKYDETEKMIQTLLQEAGTKVDATLEQNPDLTPKVRLSPESYLGFGRAEYFYPDSTLKVGTKNYVLQDVLPLHSFSFGGSWDISTDNATSSSNSFLNYHFYASKVFLVIKPSTVQSKINIYIDDKLSRQLTVDSDKLYTLYDSDLPPQDHTLKLEFLTPGTQVFAFTFG